MFSSFSSSNSKGAEDNPWRRFPSMLSKLIDGTSTSTSMSTRPSTSPSSYSLTSSPTPMHRLEGRLMYPPSPSPSTSSLCSSASPSLTPSATGQVARSMSLFSFGSEPLSNRSSSPNLPFCLSPVAQLRVSFGRLSLESVKCLLHLLNTDVLANDFLISCAHLYCFSSHIIAPSLFLVFRWFMGFPIASFSPIGFLVGSFFRQCCHSFFHKAINLFSKFSVLAGHSTFGPFFFFFSLTSLSLSLLSLSLSLTHYFCGLLARFTISPTFLKIWSL